MGLRSLEVVVVAQRPLHELAELARSKQCPPCPRIIKAVHKLLPFTVSRSRRQQQPGRGARHSGCSRILKLGPTAQAESSVARAGAAIRTSRRSLMAHNSFRPPSAPAIWVDGILISTLAFSAQLPMRPTS
jgi:hypothetical protein